MNEIDLQYKALILKRDDAIEEVKMNLRKYAKLKKNPTKYLDHVHSAGSFLIQVDSNHSFSNADRQYIKALIQEEKDKNFVDKYDYILSCLCEDSNSTIMKVWLENNTILGLQAENSNIYIDIKDAYEGIAILDEDIEYSIEDSSSIRNMQLKKHNYGIKELALEYIYNAKNGILKDEVIENIKKVPEQERNELIRYITDVNASFTSYEYRKIKRAILLFAYYFNKIDFTYGELEREMKKTGGGWKKLMPD